MSAIRISALLIVLWLLFTAIPCYAAVALPRGQTSALSLETVSEDNPNRSLGNLEPIGNSTQIGNVSDTAWATEAVYSIDAHVRDPEINPGQAVEIEIYLSGYGVPAKNKLVMYWSSPRVINEDDPGNITTIIKNYDINTGILTLGLTDIPLKRSGNISGSVGQGFVLNVGFFAHPMGIIPTPFPESGFKSVMGEWNWNGYPPILVKLNTRQDAPSGDCQVSLIFTYGNETHLKQDFKVVEFHIRSGWERWQERWQKWAIGFGVVIAFIGLFRNPIWSVIKLIWRGIRWLFSLLRKLFSIKTEAKKHRNDGKKD